MLAQTTPICVLAKPLRTVIVFSIKTVVQAVQGVRPAWL